MAKEKKLKRIKTNSSKQRDFWVLPSSLKNLGQPKYTDPDEMEQKIKEYFADCDENKKAYTMAGLAFWLGFSHTESLYRYRDSEEFGHIVKRAKLRIEQQRSEQLVQGQGVVAGQIFDLKCNFGWRETPQQLEVNNPDGNLGTKVLTVLPQEPLTLGEWHEWYNKMLEEKEKQDAIDVTQEEENDTSSIDSTSSSSR